MGRSHQSFYNAIGDRVTSFVKAIASYCRQKGADVPLGIIDDSWYQRSPGLAEEISAGGIVARLEQGQVYIALVRENRDPRYVLPKGGIDRGETIEQAARREIREEAGFSQLEYRADLGVRERLTFSKKTWKKTHYFLFVTEQVQVKPSDRRVKEVRWFAIDALPDMLWPEQKALIDFNRTEIITLIKQPSD
ncbi:MAG: NUDIX domain-containing protein [Leptolyngbyaceae cyanobacterium SL_7_1]|nr:NUDIX domain-containing protein [Leptolyngbyaceae cyanobacterium SL_7_1]